MTRITQSAVLRLENCGQHPFPVYEVLELPLVGSFVPGGLGQAVLKCLPNITVFIPFHPCFKQ